MKKYLHCLIALVSLSAFAQNFQGVAVYESKTTLDLDNSESETEGEKLPPEIEAQIQEQLKKAFEKTYTLQFDKIASLYKEEEKLEKPTGGDNISISINFSGDGIKYRNIKEKATITESEIFGKEFLVMDSLPKMDWKLGSEKKKIGNYTCHKATAIIKHREPEEKDKKAIALTDGPRKDQVITAWYTPDIPVSHGPGDYWGLPGLILEVNDGQTTLLCSKVTLNPKEKFVIKAPKKGSKVSRAEYEKIMEEKSNEMMEMNGDGPSAPGTTKTTRVMRIGG